MWLFKYVLEKIQVYLTYNQLIFFLHWLRQEYIYLIRKNRAIHMSKEKNKSF